MRFGVLGPLEVWIDGRPVPLGGPKQRALLAYLLLHANEAVSRDRLIDVLWGESPPPSASESLDTYIYRLRKLIGRDRLTRSGGGYVLSVEAGELDADKFESLVAGARQAADTGDYCRCGRVLTEALSLWRGPALADVLYQPFAGTPARQLEERRLEAVEARAEAELCCSGGAALVPELEQVVADHPLRERLVAALMLALYQAGRQADALAAFRVARGRMEEELGLEPGPEVRELEQRILCHDPALAAPRATGPRAIRPGHPRGRRSWRWAAAAALASLAIAVVVPALLRPGPAHGDLLANGVGEVTAAGGVVHHLDLPSPPGAVVTAFGSIWVASPAANEVYRIDPATGSLVQTIPVGSGPGAITAAAGNIWVANTLDGTVSRISAASQVIQTIAVGTEPTGITAGGGAIWVADDAASTLSALSPVSGRLTATVALPSAPFGVTFGAGSVWVTSPANNSVTRVDPRDGRVSQPIPVGAEPTAVTYGLGSVWVANSLDSTLARVNPSTGTVAAVIPVGDGPDALAIAGGSVWAANRLSGTLTRISPNGIRRAPSLVPVGGSPVALTVVTKRDARSSPRVWVAAGPAVSARPTGGTLRVVTSYAPASIDPGLIYPQLPPQFAAATYDTLVTFQKTGGSSGLQLVPDLALAMPTVTGGGTVYTFTLRPGLQYSIGRPVRPADFRHAIERVLALNPAAASFLDGIVGASGCTPGKPCDLARGIITDDSADTVTFRLTAPDPYFLDKLAFEFTAPVPSYVPATRPSQDPVPGTGPYMITRYVPRRLAVFARNPDFREWSAAAQPAGSPDRIVWTFGLPLAREAAEIEAGQADWSADTLPGVARLAARFPAQVHVNSLPGIVFTEFNTRVAPFNHLQVRQAFSLAANRSRFVALLGGPDQAAPSCQILPPGIPGYRPYCPFTANPGPSGAWTGPDLAAAKNLVAASGTKGMRVTVWSDDEAPDGTTAAFTVSVLRELGYRAAVHIVPNPVLALAANDSRRHIQASDGSWIADYPAASDFFDLDFRCSAFRLADPAATRNGSFFCDPAADRLMNTADHLQATAPPRAAAAWAQVDKMITRAAPWVVLAVLKNVDFLSAQVTNYQFNPVWGVLLDQLQIRHHSA